MNKNQRPTIVHVHRYRVEKLLGTGVQGTAYLVEDLRYKRNDKMKVLKKVPAMNMDPDETIDAQREAGFLRKLNHPHIVKLFDNFVEDGYFCIVTEYCELGDLDTYLKSVKSSGKKLEESQIINFITQLIMGLHEIHSQKILHRDLKPSNIFINGDWTLKIGDFGISRILMSSIDRASTFCGAPLYMSPEVLQHVGYSTKADIWSLGVLLYKMCTFKNAFEGHGLMGVMFRVVCAEPEPITGYSEDLCHLCKKMLMKDPDQRPSTVQLLQNPIVENQAKRPGARNYDEKNAVVQNENINISPAEALKLRKLQAADKRADELKAAIRDKSQMNHFITKSIGNKEDENKNYQAPFPIEDKIKHFSIFNLKDTFDLNPPNSLRKNNTVRQPPSNQGVGAEDELAVVNPSPQRKISDSVCNYVPNSKDERPITPLKNWDEFYNPKYPWSTAKDKILADKQLAETYYLENPGFEEEDDTVVSYSRSVESVYKNLKENPNKSNTFKDDDINGAFGTESKERKKISLRETCISCLGKEKFEKVYKQMKQTKNRSDMNTLVKKFGVTNEEGFLIEQLIFLEEN